MELRQRALQALCTADPSLKAARARDLLPAWGDLDIPAEPPVPSAVPPGISRRP